MKSSASKFGYNFSFLPGDLSAGLTIGVMLIPQGMAYALLAGLPPIYGLYGATVPLLVYALVGSFPKLAVGPTAISSILVASGLFGLAELGTPSYIELAILLAAMVGVLQLLMGVSRMGNLVKFIHPVALSGFTTGVAVLVAVGQLDYLLGVRSEGAHFAQKTWDLLHELPNLHGPTVWIGAGSVILLWVARKIHKRIPSQIILVLLGILVVWSAGLAEKGVAVLGLIPEGLPSFSLPTWEGAPMVKMLPSAITIALLSFIEALAINTALQQKYETDDVRPNHEFMALGASNLIGSLFLCFPVSGGLSRTAVNDEAGANTRLASLISVGVVVLTLLFLTPYFYHLPEAVLAAIIFVAILGLIDPKGIRQLWRSDRVLFFLFLTTALHTLFLGVTIGIAVGIGLSVFYFLVRKKDERTIP